MNLFATLDFNLSSNFIKFLRNKNQLPAPSAMKPNIFAKKQTHAKRVSNLKKLHKVFDLYQFIDRKKFKSLVEKWEMDKHVRDFETWEMTVALITCLVFRFQSYKDVQSVLGIPKSTFGDALKKRFYGFFQELCTEILLTIRARTKSRAVKKAIREILAIDSSDVTVHGSLFDQPGWQKKHSNDAHEASGKLHVVWNVNGEWIEDFIITPGRSGDSPISLRFELQRGVTYVFDRAYNDLSFWVNIIDAASNFVCRLKNTQKNKALEVDVLKKNKGKDGVLYDEKYCPSDAHLKKHGLKDRTDIQLRHIIYRDPIAKKVFHFVSSDLKCAARTIAAIYKRRWAVELLFKWLKGHLNIRYLPVKNANAVKTMLAAAVLVQLLLQLKKISQAFKGTLWELLSAIRNEHQKKALDSSASPEDCRWNTNPVAEREAS
jgi:putative transposase